MDIWTEGEQHSPCCTLTGSGCMKGDRKNNKGSHSLLSIPLYAIFCFLNKKWKKRGRWFCSTQDKEIPWRLWLSWSFKDSWLIELFTCKQQLSFSFSHTHTGLQHIFILFAITMQPLHTLVFSKTKLSAQMWTCCCRLLHCLCACSLCFWSASLDLGQAGMLN